jgi:hypothetical protein
MITPGVTTRLEALSTLGASPYVRESTLKEAGTNVWGGATWQWSTRGRRLQPSIAWHDGIVREITLGLTFDLALNEAITEFGQPEAISAGPGGTPEHWYWIVDLYYPGSGLQMKAYTAEYSTVLEPTTEVGVAQIFAPTTLEDRIATVYGDAVLVAHELSTVRPWLGYGDLFVSYYISPAELDIQE